MQKTKLIEALRRFIAQKPGLEFANYGDLRIYRSEMRSITKDRHQAEALLRYVEIRSTITAEMILNASDRAFSGRLEIEVLNGGEDFSIGYCVGQYFPTEYRKAVCAVLASAVWDSLRSDMPPTNGIKKIPKGFEELPYEIETVNGLTPGEWLRRAAVRELGRPIASRWLS